MANPKSGKKAAPKKQEPKIVTTIKKKKDYTIEKTEKTLKNKHTATFVKYQADNDKFIFDAIGTTEMFYNKILEEYPGKFFFMKALTPAGWYTVASSNKGLTWTSNEDYFEEGKVKDPLKFNDAFSAITVTIR
jgi:hypothetical protein